MSVWMPPAFLHKLLMDAKRTSALRTTTNTPVTPKKGVANTIGQNKSVSSNGWACQMGGALEANVFLSLGINRNIALEPGNVPC